MAIEEKNIGIEISTNGTFVNSELVNGKIELTKDGDGVYYKDGSWTSTTVDIGDNFKEYGKLIITNINNRGSSISLFTRTSDDGMNFGNYVSVAEDNSILSQKKRFIQVQIKLFAGIESEKYLMPLSDMTNDYTEVESGNLKLKRNYTSDMTRDNTWTDVGGLYRDKITRDTWTRIDGLEVGFN